ncbi:hypothetical protein [Xenorhabdus thuongxuanensis]|uniref:NgrE n=1 Tax=Xenorhabdus thuongxuanensis TaxID=1873484 RepID=A0A1Q5U3Q6_9GAMM|nr:hypothetical protein [Xenorhabdus thuongxuanensis]OKP07108.1 NgrE [Xenorhabdus thuongxuanensis]
MFYSQGTISTVSGSAIVRGTGTQFISNINGVAPGQIILIRSGNNNLNHMIQAVNSDTELVLVDTIPVTLNNVKYQIQTTVPDSVSDGVRHILANTSYITLFLQNMDKWMSQNGVVDVTLPNGQTVSLQSIKALYENIAQLNQSIDNRLEKSKNGADIPNTAEFVNNLGLRKSVELAENAMPKSGGFMNGELNAFRVSSHSGGERYMMGVRKGAAFLDYWDGKRWAGEIHHPKVGGMIWCTGNTTIVDGFLKKASPIIKIWSDGKFETNDESEGATVEHLSEGVYLIKNVLGFNADAAWGGVDGGVEIPLCKNKLPLIWVDYKVLPDGSIKLMTYHREHADAPVFARNVRDGYADGDPIDIPVGRSISVRVQMPADSVWNVRQGEVGT